MDSSQCAEASLLKEVEALDISVSRCLATQKCVTACSLSRQLDLLRTKVVELGSARGLDLKASGMLQGSRDPAPGDEAYWRLG